MEYIWINSRYNFLIWIDRMTRHSEATGKLISGFHFEMSPVMVLLWIMVQNSAIVPFRDISTPDARGSLREFRPDPECFPSKLTKFGLQPILGRVRKKKH